MTVGGSIGCAGSGSVMRWIAERVGDGAFLQPGDRHDIAGMRIVDRLTLQPTEG